MARGGLRRLLGVPHLGYWLRVVSAVVRAPARFVSIQAQLAQQQQQITALEQRLAAAEQALAARPRRRF